MSYRIHQGDVLAVLRSMPDTSFDACLSDPPYGLSFMGKQWDHGVPSADVWRGVLRVLKPGAMLLAFGGTRTHHRLACAIEDAGFEIRDCLMWLYGSGFPKSLDVSKALDKAAGAERGRIPFAQSTTWREREGRRDIQASVPDDEAITDAAKTWDGYGTALKPAWEPIILAMKPLDGTFAANALKHGVAGLNVDGGRIQGPPSTHGGPRCTANVYAGQWQTGVEDYQQNPAGRWPANVLLDPESAAMLDAQSGETVSTGGKFSGANAFGQDSGWNAHENKATAIRRVDDSGGASRFFYIAKADSAERHASGKNAHPTVKPIDLAAYLSRLILPPKRDTARRLIVPFCGSGSEIIGALRAGWERVEGIEREVQYVNLAHSRIVGDAPLLNHEAAS